MESCDSPSPAKLSVEPVERLEQAEVLAKEGSLGGWPGWQAADMETEACAGNSEKFTMALANICRELGVEVVTDTKVHALHGSSKVEQIVTDKEILVLGPKVEVVVAAGAWSPLLLSTLGIYCPVYPMKG